MRYTVCALFCALIASAAGVDWDARLAQHGLIERGGGAWDDVSERSWSASASRRLTAGREGTRLRATSEPAADEAAGRRTLAERRARFLAQFDGDIGYPGMVTRTFSVPEDFRPRVAPPGPDGGSLWLSAATERFTYGPGAADLVRYVAALSLRWCPAARRVVELELFFPKESFSEKRALSELSAFSCSPRNGKK